MRVGLIDVDGHNFPNLALMKLSRYYKNKNDIVELNGIGDYDIIYKSKVFTFTNNDNGLYSSLRIIEGGTGYKNYNTLSDDIEHIEPDYDLYKTKYAYGFLTRGCIRKCSWCIVPQKEGTLRANADISEFIGNKKSAILLDNNVLASDWGLAQIEKIISLKIKIDFNQGLDSRIIANNSDIAKLLSRVKWLKPIRMACDTKSQMNDIEKATSLLRQYGATPKRYFIYVLVKDISAALERVEFLRRLNLDPFAQPYRDFSNNKIDYEAKRFARWVNRKAIFKTIPWNEYK
ncbi:MAG: radical SAM protein [Candidatus Nanoarchaeia archaeon]|nr:radical SAM protein [Candidatus Nanoarchaeia archaeon]